MFFISEAINKNHQHDVFQRAVYGLATSNAIEDIVELPKLESFEKVSKPPLDRLNGKSTRTDSK